MPKEGNMKFNVQITRFKKADEEAWIVVEADSEENAYGMVSEWLDGIEERHGEHQETAPEPTKLIANADWYEVHSEVSYGDGYVHVGECVDA